MNGGDVMIVHIALPGPAVLLLQGLLTGEDGLATFRDREGRLELWSTWAQREELDDWLDSLPPALEIAVVDRYAFEPSAAMDRGDKGGT